MVEEFWLRRRARLKYFHKAIAIYPLRVHVEQKSAGTIMQEIMRIFNFKV